MLYKRRVHWDRPSSERIQEEIAKIMQDNIKKIFKKFFEEYKIETGKGHLSYVTTSTYRRGSKTNPHAIRGNAIDFTLRTNGSYSTIFEYNEIFKYMIDNWPYRAGIDNTWGNIHIHIDLGKTKVTDMPFFFKEDNQRFLYRITNHSEV